MSEPIISVSGLRGIIGVSLTPEVAMRFAAAYASDLRSGPLVLGYDGRPSGRIFLDACSSVLRALGHSVWDADLVSTPTLGVLVRQHHAVGGIQISASHNPPEYNGLKLFDSKGSVLTAAAGGHLVTSYRTVQPAWVTHEKIAAGHRCEDTTSAHLNLVLETVDCERIRARKFRVLLDANHGSGSRLGLRLLESLGCDVHVLGGEPDGRFAHPPEPIEENLGHVGKQVVAQRADIGFCQDPDADRLAVIDEKGTFLGEEYTLALCVSHVLSKTPGTIVTNCATSRACDDIAAKYGVSCLRSAVGEANVVQMMRGNDAIFGGEGNGGPIDPRVGFVRDSFVGMALILDALAARKTTISNWAAEIPRYEIFKRRVSFSSAKLPQALDALEQHFAPAQASRLDGLRLDWPDQWLLIRGSNTEPIVRVIAEAKTQDAAIHRALEAIRILANFH